jgi:hypothetical protein|nr:MAG TPA: hypothetical protein [Caudoviricetes sp.]
MKEKKDLAEEYLDRKIKQEPFKSLTKGFEYAFSAEDIKAAFNAGRESVVENIPELRWESSWKGVFAQTHIGRYFIALDDSLTINGVKLYYPVGNFGPASGYAKEAANRNYKTTLKLALGL